MADRLSWKTPRVEGHLPPEARLQDPGDTCRVDAPIPNLEGTDPSGRRFCLRPVGEGLACAADGLRGEGGIRPATNYDSYSQRDVL